MPLEAEKKALNVLQCAVNNRMTTDEAIKKLTDLWNTVNEDEFNLHELEHEDSKFEVYERLIAEAGDLIDSANEPNSLGGMKKRKGKTKQNNKTMKRGGALRKMPASQIDRIVKGEKDRHVVYNIAHPQGYYNHMKEILKNLKFGRDVNLAQIRIYEEAIRQASPGSRPKLSTPVSSKSSSRKSSSSKSSSRKSSSSKSHPM
jgi:hypothetical protein